MTADAAAMRLFARQHNQAHVRQLHQLGSSKDQITHRVRQGLFERVGHGVVALTGRMKTVEERTMRAVLATTSPAVACLWTAAKLHGIDAPRDDRVHVVVRHGSVRHPVIGGDVTVHQSRAMPTRDRARVREIPVTSLVRTLIDCVAASDQWLMVQMLDSVAPSATTWRQIHEVATRMSNGRPRVRSLGDLTGPHGSARLRSTLERVAREAFRANGITGGRWNVVIRDGAGRIREVDVCFDGARVIVEFDGLRFHAGVEPFQRDRETDRRLQLAGWLVLRFTWRDVAYDPARMVSEVRRALSGARSRAAAAHAS